MIAGNHDHGSNVSAQIAYTKISPRWHFPNFFYTKVLKLPGTSKTVQLVMLDTTMLCCRNQLKKLRKFSSQRQQLTWIKDTLRSSTADFLIVAGHHPVFSAGSHGNTRYLETKLKPLLEENNVTVYLSGHDHSLQHFKENNSIVNYFVSGAGGGNFHRRSHWNKEHHKIVSTKIKFFNGYYGAFTLFEATPEFLKITQINENGKELYKAQLRPRNSRTVVAFDFIKPKTQPKLTPSVKPTLKPKTQPKLTPKSKPTIKPVLVPRGISNLWGRL
ncbi:tartrate-resistant acid phosphatase type 5-like isoform X1 [Orbicella faveolata]|uniref:tartrate-resistant acid phosphatase type 5-like isoform X1 n=1 Tax=Orbicella faveolata TaxID=48498 RepID=UPI0009E3AF64|nr:tartrate-resistant acid phosphatase type 5-like isoform X1 [Orbicella faveolata]